MSLHLLMAKATPCGHCGSQKCHHKLLNTLGGWEAVLRWARWPVMPVEGTVVGYSWCLCEPVSNTGVDPQLRHVIK